MGNTPTKTEATTLNNEIFIVQRYVNTPTHINVMKDVFAIRRENDTKYSIEYCLMKNDKKKLPEKGCVACMKTYVFGVDIVREYINNAFVASLAHEKERYTYAIYASPMPCVTVTTSDIEELQTCLNSQLNVWCKINGIVAITH